MFSLRTPERLVENRVAAFLRERGGARWDLTVTNPTAVGLPSPPPDLLALLATPAAARYEPDPRGLRGAREAVAGWYATHGVDADPDRIVLTASTSEAYGWLLKLLCQPGDAVLVPAPSYPLLDALAELESVALRRYPLAAEDRYAAHAAPILARVEALARHGTRVGAVVLVTPNNPTGTSMPAREREAILDGARRHGFAVIADEVFLDYRFENGGDEPVVAAARDDALVFSLGGLSKTAALPQLKLGWILVNGPEPVRREALQRLEWIADAYLSVGTPIQLAAPSLLARAAALRAPLQARLESNRAILRESFPAGGATALLPIPAGWSAVLRVPATEPEDEIALRLLRDEDVLVHPGFFYEFPHEAFLVTSLLPEPSLFREGLARLSRSLSR